MAEQHLPQPRHRRDYNSEELALIRQGRDEEAKTRWEERNRGRRNG